MRGIDRLCFACPVYNCIYGIGYVCNNYWYNSTNYNKSYDYNNQVYSHNCEACMDMFFFQNTNKWSNEDCYKTRNK